MCIFVCLFVCCVVCSVACLFGRLLACLVGLLACVFAWSCVCVIVFCVFWFVVVVCLRVFVCYVLAGGLVGLLVRWSACCLFVRLLDCVCVRLLVSWLVCVIAFVVCLLVCSC